MAYFSVVNVFRTVIYEGNLTMRAVAASVVVIVFTSLPMLVTVVD